MTSPEAVTPGDAGAEKQPQPADGPLPGAPGTDPPRAWTEVSADELREIERFLYDDAALLDAWELDRWLERVTDDVTYVVPATDVRTGNPNRTLTFVNDDIVRLRARVTRLTSRRAYREYPWSRTRRMVTNVRVAAEDGGPHYLVSANFTVHWFRNRRRADFIGRYHLVLRRTNGSLRLAQRTSVLDLEALDPHGAVSIIL